MTSASYQQVQRAPRQEGVTNARALCLLLLSLRRLFLNPIGLRHPKPSLSLRDNLLNALLPGYTDTTVGLVNTHYVYMPISTIIQAPRRVNPTGRRWNRLVTAINQPDFA